MSSSSTRLGINHRWLASGAKMERGPTASTPDMFNMLTSLSFCASNPTHIRLTNFDRKFLKARLLFQGEGSFFGLDYLGWTIFTQEFTHGYLSGLVCLVFSYSDSLSFFSSTVFSLLLKSINKKINIIPLHSPHLTMKICTSAKCKDS